MSEFEEQVMGAEGITAADLMKKEFPEPRWAIPGILPEGLNMLAGKPKKGKSIMALNLGLNISLGGLALGKIPVEQGAVIYLALEDTERRLQGRLRQMLYTDPAPENLYLYTKWPRMDAGGLELLETRISEIPNIRLVIIDTLHKFRKPARSNSNLYAEDYETVCQIKDVADRLGVCILLIHHQRKSEAEDIFDTMSGSLGLTGGTDGNLVMESNKGNTILHITGRDVEEVELAIELDGRMLAWRLLGERSEVKSTHEQQRVYNALKESHDALSPSEIADITGLNVGTVKKILPKFMEDQSVERTTYGRYTIKEKEF
ncbi:MAG TPA: AAA family ATPase [Deltaproteobacteria bacterium]|nr:AAA family ATPase [Deltaproteobacteria bacterium]